MAKHKKRIDGDLAKANLTPMIDVTFQLIIFFLLVNNIVSQESVSMLVPKLYQPKVVELGDVRRIVVNIVPPNEPADRKLMPDALKVDGRAMMVQIASTEYTYAELDRVTESLKEAVARNENVQVLLRADAGTHYANVQPVLAHITAAGIKQVNLVAFLPDEGPPNLNER